MTALEPLADRTELGPGKELSDHSANRNSGVKEWFPGRSAPETLTEEGRLRKERVALKIGDALEYLDGYHEKMMVDGEERIKVFGSGDDFASRVRFARSSDCGGNAGIEPSVRVCVMNSVGKRLRVAR